LTAIPPDADGPRGARRDAERRLEELGEAWRRRREDGAGSGKGPSERRRRALAS
jgi:hypothetical protein